MSDFKASLSRTGMIDYYKDRCRRSENRTLAFFLRDMEQGGASKPPIVPREAVGDFHDICFNRPIERQLREVEDATTGRSDMLARLVWMGFELVAIAVTLPFPPASFAVGATLALRDSALALQAYAEGDLETASTYILSSLLNSLGAGADASVGMKGFGALRKLRPGNTQPSASTPAKIVDQAALRPTRLEGETFWLGKPDANGYAPVFRVNTAQPENPVATGQLARRDAAGSWQPLSQPVAQPAGGVADRFAVDLSLKNTTPLVSAHGTGVSQLGGKYYIELEARIFEVQFDARARHWNIVDPQNPFAFFGKRPVRLNDQGKWQLIERQGLRGGAGDSFTPLHSDSAGSIPSVVEPYELPHALRLHYRNIVSSEDPLGWGLEEYFDSIFREMRSTFASLRETLYRDACEFFDSAALPARPTLPQLAPHAGIDTLITKVFENSHSMVVSEPLRSVASKRFLIKNMALLAEQNVEILYIPHLFTDLHMSKLEKYRKLGGSSKAGSSELKFWLDSLYAGQLRTGSKEFDYYHLIKAAHQHGIEVRPLSSSTSYPLANHPVASAVGDITTEQKMSTFFAHKLISADVAANPTRRWVALLDQRLANTYRQVPGIAELQGTISVRLQDLPGGQPTRISRDIASTGAEFTQGDFKVELARSMISETYGTSSANVATRTLPSQLDEALFRQMHGNAGSRIDNPFTEIPGFEWHDSRGWQPVEAAQWAVETQPTAIQLSLRDTTYATPAEMRNTLFDLANFEGRGLDSRYFFSKTEQANVRDTFFSLRRNLRKDASQVTSSELPTRPAMPTAPTGASHADFLEKLYQHTDGVVIGESHSSIASKKIIIEHLPQLARQQVKTLYMEHLLTDLHQVDLDRFIETGHMSKALLHDLKKLDRGHLTDANGIYTFEQLVIQARAHGMDVRAIDCSASYHLKGVPNETATTRQEMFSYFASRTLRKHQQVMGSHKWLALVGNSHANTFDNAVPGLAELEGGIGVRVVDVAPGTGSGISVDPGERLRDVAASRTPLVKSDYRIEMEVSRPAFTVSLEQLMTTERRLTRPGMFFVEEGESGLKTIVHRSRDNTIHRTPILSNAEGRLYVERPRWTEIHLKPFDDMETLIACLEWLNMTKVG